MKKDKFNIEQRLSNLSNMYSKITNAVDSLPSSVPVSVKSLIKEKIFTDKELKDMMNGLDSHRPPRFLVIGRTGVGKSSLINAICGAYLAETSAVQIGTLGMQSYDCIQDGKVRLQILDTRGIGESLDYVEKKKSSAEDELEKEISKFLPDAILFVLPCAARDHLGDDIQILNKIRKKVAKDTPIIVILNRADEMEPKQSDMTSERKLNNIQGAIAQVKKMLLHGDVPFVDIVPVSSYIDWGYSIEAINVMTSTQRENLDIEYDGRYNIDLLNDIIENCLKEEAKTGFLLAAKLDYLLDKIANKLVNIFSTIAAGVASTPIPISDIYILTSLQIVMVVIIATLSGIPMDTNAAKKFIFSTGGVGISGVVFRGFAQQSAKLINILFPIAGSTVSSAIAFMGTKVMGEAAIDYFIHKKDLSEVKKKINQYVKEKEKN